MSALTLRDYQSEAIEAVWNHLSTTDGNCIGVLPTGCGKSLVLAEFIRRALIDYPGTRILVLAHVRELLQQNVAELLRHWPQAPVGIYSAGLGKRDLHAQVLFASIQSIHKKAYRLPEAPDLVLVDEAHLIPRSSNATYRKFLADLKVINKYTRVVGWTATPWRTDSGMVHKGKDAIFSSIAYEYNILDAIKGGYLCPPVSKPSTVQIDTSNVGTRGGEFIPGELEAAAIHPETVEAIANEIVKHGHDRKGWLFFGSGIKHCELMRDALRVRGITCECIFGNTPTAERDRIIEAYKRQEIRCLSAMNVLLIGFNAPHTDLLAMGRATKSCGLWIQAVGRALRLFPGKADALILCFGGNIARHGKIDRPLIKDKRESDVPGAAPQKICPECEAGNPIAARECVECGFEFPPVETKIDTKASTASLLSNQIAAEWIPVNKVTARRHSKPGKPDSLMVMYHSGLTVHREWVLLQHTGYPRSKACAWWNKRFPGEPVPNTVAEALDRINADGELITLSGTKHIQVRPSGAYMEIVGYKFA